MESLRLFRRENHLYQKDVADYLDVTIGFISAVERGASKLSEDKVQMLLQNPYGWDTGSLVDEPDTTYSAEKQKSKDERLAVALAEITALKQERDLLLEQLDWKNRLVDRLLKILESRGESNGISQD